MFIDFISKCPFCFTYILHMAFNARNQMYDVRKFTDDMFW